jgi:hypothetical protein
MVKTISVCEFVLPAFPGNHEWCPSMKVISAFLSGILCREKEG